MRIVAIGGGTGLSTLLKGLKHYVPHANVPNQAKSASSVIVIDDLTAIVTVTDDGGSSGRLRREFNILPPGDIRNCIVALSEDEATMSRLFQYRFPETSGLLGHSFGNLFLTALTATTGDFAEAVRLSSEILATRGHIYPATTATCELEAQMDDGTLVRGETNITASKCRIVKLQMIPPDVKPMTQTLEAIAAADLITIGPGSLFTSLIPNVLVNGIPQAIADSPALKVYVCNLMTQANESLGLTASEHIKAIRQHAGVKLFDAALLNVKQLAPDLQAKYALEGASQIVIDEDEVRNLGVKPVLGDYLYTEKGVARHNTDRVAKELMQLAAARALTTLSN
ncbi:MAG TPA: uridine diphosphate-N-acetylglucosamine-binding protein YvcK [Terriglobales bacterium]|nr:uridine diphosphate-N-acetylglucosamine-binding protein YvcK [Terriglobales bacterium]